MRVFLTGGSGVLGRVLARQLANANHQTVTPRHFELDLYNLEDVTQALKGADAAYHLATRIPPPEAQGLPGAWDENNRLRQEASRVLVDAALASDVRIFVQASVTFVYPEGPADEETPVAESDRLASMLEAERQTGRFTAAGGRGVVLRLGLLCGPTTGLDDPGDRYDAMLHISDAGSAMLAALAVPAGVYNVVSDGGRISNARFKAATGWRPAF